MIVHINNCFIRANVLWEMCVRANVIRGNIRLGNCPFGELSFAELSVGELSVGEISSGNCPSGKHRSGKRPDTTYIEHSQDIYMASNSECQVQSFACIQSSWYLHCYRTLHYRTVLIRYLTSRNWFSRSFIQKLFIFVKESDNQKQ